MSLGQHLATPTSYLRSPLLEDYPLLDLRAVSQKRECCIIIFMNSAPPR